MTLFESVLRFLSSKYFTLVLEIVLICVLPFTYHNFQVVYQAGQISQFWYIVAVFVINVLSIGLCIYKFMGAITKKEIVQTQEW